MVTLNHDYVSRIVEKSHSGFRRRTSRSAYPRFSGARVGYRFYDKNVGKWTTQDPLGVEVGFNAYSFCDDDPLNFVDPYGQSWRSIVGGFASGSGFFILAGVGVEIFTGGLATPIAWGLIAGGVILAAEDQAIEHYSNANLIKNTVNKAAAQMDKAHSDLDSIYDMAAHPGGSPPKKKPCP
jgi:RHS repeat-associated protein